MSRGGRLSRCRSSPAARIPAPSGLPRRDDLHLRSTKAIAGYQIVATDGALRSVRRFMVEEKRWTLRELVTENGPWLAGKAVLISTYRSTRISDEESTVVVNLTAADIRRTAENEVAKTYVRKHEKAP